MKAINFELSSTVKYSNGSGEEVEANFIELKEPTGKVSHLCCEIESLIQSGMIRMSSLLGDDVVEDAKEEAKDRKESGVEEVFTPETAIAIMAGGGVDMKKVVVNFRELFKAVAMIGGEKPLTAPRMDDMSHADFRKMMGTYAANFILS